MGVFGRSPGFFVCLSAVLLALGTYLQTGEIPVRITPDLSAVDQYDLMRALWPVGLLEKTQTVGKQPAFPIISQICPIEKCKRFHNPF